ncbi:AAA family ATPase [candidate division KSB1 bacterium]|nr:AAA family ATPase [candidate division KSB1 bacterium]
MSLKTSLARQIAESRLLPTHYSSVDEPGLKGNNWIEQQWEISRRQARLNKALLILDEIQKVTDWSETVKKLWDEDTIQKCRLQVILLVSSSPLLMQKGLSESRAGCFEIIPITH